MARGEGEKIELLLLPNGARKVHLAYKNTLWGIFILQVFYTNQTRKRFFLGHF